LTNFLKILDPEQRLYPLIEIKLGEQLGYLHLLPAKFGGRESALPDSVSWRPILQSEDGSLTMVEISDYDLDELKQNRSSLCSVRHASLRPKKGADEIFYVREGGIVGFLVVKNSG
jgi:hypothetical protein